MMVLWTIGNKEDKVRDTAFPGESAVDVVPGPGGAQPDAQQR